MRVPVVIGARELVDEDHGSAGTRLFVIELHAIVGRQVRHGMSSINQNAVARAERPASIVTTDPLV